MINPVLITPAGLKVYRDGDFDLHARRNAKGNIYLPCDLSDHKDKKRKRLRINLNSGFIRCMDPACVQNGILESKYNEWMQFHVKKCRKYSVGQKPRLDKMIKICSPEVIRYLKEERGIEDISLLDEMGIREIDWYYDGETARSLIFPFYVGDEIVNYQVKRADGKRGFRMSNGMPMLYNINAATGQSEVFITEGEMDAVALTCCGFKNVISVANGAGTSQECFDNCKEYLASVETYYLATDMDEVGEGYRDKLIRMLGAANCRMVRWRWMDEDGWHEAKDANETLKKGGKPAVESCVRSSVPCPVPNLVRASDVKEMVMNYYYNGRPVGKTLGMGSFDNYVKFQTGRMYVVSGQPGTGKTTLIDYWLIRLACKCGWKSAVYSPEKFPVADHYQEFSRDIIGKPAFRDNMTEMEIEAAMKFLDDNIFTIDHHGLTHIEDILLTMEATIEAHDTKVLVIDPFNYISLDAGGASETLQITNILISIQDFARQHDILAIVMAHPKKLNIGPNGHLLSMGLYDISGSAGFNNLCDLGIIIEHIDEGKVTAVNVLKVRYRGEIGNPGTAYLWYNHSTGRYGEVLRTQDENDVTRYRYTFRDTDKRNMLPREGKQQSIDFDSAEPSGTGNDDMCPF